MFSWTICKQYAPHSRHIATPASHHSISTGQARCFSDTQPTVSKHWRHTYKACNILCIWYSILIMGLHVITILSRWDLKYSYSTITLKRHWQYKTSAVFFLFVLLSSHIELNPRPSVFILCTLINHSILHPLHSAALSDLMDTHNRDLFTLTETWIKPTTTSAELLNCTPPHYSLISTARNGSSKISSSGSGTSFLIREPFTQLPTSVPDYSSIKSSSVTATFSFKDISLHGSMSVKQRR